MVLGARPIVTGRREAAEMVTRSVPARVSAGAVTHHGRVTGSDGQRVTVARRHGVCQLWSGGVQWAC